MITTSVLVVGAGVSGLVTAHRLVAAEPGIDLVVVEEGARAGGVMRTDHVDGFAFEWGPNAFVNNVPETLALVRELGLDSRLVVASRSARKRFVYKRDRARHGRLCALPLSPVGLLASPVLSLRGALRVLAEPFVRRGSVEDESVAAFGRRRLGAEATAMLLDPLATGVYGGDVERLSVSAAFPRIASLEKEHGGLIVGLLAEARQRSRARHAAGEAATRRTLCSFRGGMGELAAALEKRLGERLRLNEAVEVARPVDGGFEAQLRGGDVVRPRALVVATPARKAEALLRSSLPQLAGHLGEIPHAPIAVVCLGYRRDEIHHPLDGFGFLAPRAEGLRILGAVWVSSVYPDHAPPGAASLRVMLGGAHDPQVVGKSPEELFSLSTAELAPLLGVRGEPLVHRVYRYRDGIPQYNVGHARRLSEIDRLASSVPGLFLTGNAYRGVAVNDCVASGERLAARVGAFLKGGT